MYLIAHYTAFAKPVGAMQQLLTDLFKIQFDLEDKKDDIANAVQIVDSWVNDVL